MTGKQLKDFAARIPDDAIVQVPEKYGSDWESLDSKKIRANLIVLPVVTMEQVCNIEDVSA